MRFTDVIGQQQIKERLFGDVLAGKVPHALLFQGNMGHGTLALALAYAKALLCEQPTSQGACNICKSCLHTQSLTNLDIHFTYPIIKKGDNTSVEWSGQWSKFLQQNDGAYFIISDWVAAMAAQPNKKKDDDKADKVGQTTIYTAESQEISHHMSLKSASGGYKVALIWLPEYMDASCANKLLKVLEEPPPMSVFLLVSEKAEQLLDTVRSRCRSISVPPIDEPKLATTIEQQFNISNDIASSIAHNSVGDYIKACQQLKASDSTQDLLDCFTQIMRNSYTRDIREMKKWSDQMAEKQSVEFQKQFLSYAAKMVRESFIFNLKTPQLNYLLPQERQFLSRFAPFIHEVNAMNIMNEIDVSLKHLERNVNKKMIFFNFALQLTILIKTPKQ